MLERFDDAKKRGAKIYGELVGYAMNSDASDFVLPNPVAASPLHGVGAQQGSASTPSDIDLVSTHATATDSGDVQECIALRKVFHNGSQPAVNNTKSFIGHAMGAAGALELAGNLPAFDDNVCHPTINVDRLDPECALPGLAH